MKPSARPGVGCYIAPLLVFLGLAWSGIARAATLPERPEQTAEQVEKAIADGQCPEQAIYRGQAALPACDGVILPTVVWAHLEMLADDSRTVRALYALEVERAGYELAAERRQVQQLQAELSAERAPVPMWQRPGVSIGLSMAGGAAAVLAGGWALSIVGGA